MIEIIIAPKSNYIPLYYQPIYKVAQLLLILDTNSNRRSASISFLHTIAWAMRSEENTQLLLDLKNKKREHLVDWSYEPIMGKVISIALINKYCKLLSSNGKIKLTSKGASLIKIIRQANLFEEERNTLNKIGLIDSDLLTPDKEWEIKINI